MSDAIRQRRDCCIPQCIHATASISVPFEAFIEYCTEHGVSADQDQLNSWILEQFVNANELDEILKINLVPYRPTKKRVLVKRLRQPNPV